MTAIQLPSCNWPGLQMPRALLPAPSIRRYRSVRQDNPLSHRPGHLDAILLYSSMQSMLNYYLASGSQSLSLTSLARATYNLICPYGDMHSYNGCPEQGAMSMTP